MSSDLLSELQARCIFPPSGTEVDCAVSGGADSLALLLLAVNAGLKVTAWHVDHGLRETSSDEGKMVFEVASDLGVKANCLKAFIEDGPNLEARARDVRRDVLPPQILTGHTADDQAETVILNLLRGSGVQGTAGIGDPHRRPILDLRRHETKKLCLSEQLDPVNDPMNLDPRFTRNRIRNEVIPLLAEVTGRDPVPLLARHANLAGEASGILADLIKDLDITDVRSVADVPDPVVRFAIQDWLTDKLGLPADSSSVNRVLQIVRGEIKGTEIPGGFRVDRSQGKVRFSVNTKISQESD
ncbi:MAG: tRNA lysidine(34) synthetase TilS [Acidimicrobiaceae bacterium]|nr:tRNA lysidine(34) synthetase TilS [Acidimicrobiaceae bacterium]